MNVKRGGYSLTEMLVIIVLLVVLMTLTVRPMRTMISEIPRSARICQTLNGTQKALAQLKKDIEESIQITSFNDGVLTIEHSSQTINYTFADGKILRNPAMNDPDGQYVWQLPFQKMDAKLWRDNGTPYGFELNTWNQQNVLGTEQIRFNQTVVFFRKGKQQ